jgi:Ala-tRNA(Pro) deacylase
MPIYDILDDLGITYQRYDHPAVYTVADVKRLVPDIPGAKVKNLLICDHKGRRHFLVVTGADKRLDMKALGRALGCGRVRFASPTRLRDTLGIEPGSVSLLAVVNDNEGRVEVVIDQALWQCDRLQFHPLVNTSTLVLSREDVRRLLQKTGHGARIMEVPGSP